MTASHQKGLSLVELVITIVILAIALVGLTSVLGGGLSQSAETLPNVRAVALAQSYLDEILSKRFDEQSRPNGIPPCRASSSRPCSTYRPARSVGAGLLDRARSARVEDRSRPDDVDDYHAGRGRRRPPRCRMQRAESAVTTISFRSTRYVDDALDRDRRISRRARSLTIRMTPLGRSRSATQHERHNPVSAC